jgi:thiamine-phosphate pyrophosphorylase
MSLPSPLLVITDRTLAHRALREVCADAFAGGCRWLMVREKDLARKRLSTLVSEVVDGARAYGAIVSVNGDAGLAAACGARGVHLPRDGDVYDARRVMGDDSLVGVSAHSMAEALRAREAGADYVTISPIYLSESKPGYGPALGLDELRRVALAVPMPVIALGGITAQNASACLDAGATGVAVMGVVMRADDPKQVVSDLLQCLISMQQ